MTKDPVEILSGSRMAARQIVAIALCVILNGIDGFDVLSVSFASPGIVEEWNISRSALGVVLSMELIGMAAGSILLGNLADRIGRRPVILGCLVVMATGMFAAGLSGSVTLLSACRFYTGLGIGGMLACTNAMVAELSNDRYRSLNVSIMATGYPVGAIIGGAISSQLLSVYDWRAVFLFGGVCTALMLPAVWFALPESISSIVARRPADALQSVNRILKGYGHAALAALPEISVTEGRRSSGVSRLLGPALLQITILLTAAYFAHIMTFYYILKWIPKIVVDMGYVPSEAGSVLVWANIGGACGGLLLAIGSSRLNIRWLVIGALAMSVILVSWFGRGAVDLKGLALISASAGFFTNAGVVGLYALIAHYFPADVRAGGTGFVIGIGRGGAALGPIVAGILFESGQGLQMVSILMASGSMFAVIALVLLGLRARPATGSV